MSVAVRSQKNVLLVPYPLQERRGLLGKGVGSVKTLSCLLQFQTFKLNLKLARVLFWTRTRNRYVCAGHCIVPFTRTDYFIVFGRPTCLQLGGIKHAYDTGDCGFSSFHR